MRKRVPAAERAIEKVTSTALGPYQSAIVRIGFAGTWLFFLLRELPHRAELYGSDGPWNWDMAQRLTAENGAFTVLMWSDGRAWFEIVYATAMVSSALLLLGWRTRTMSVLFMVGVLSLQNRSIFMGDGGDNVIHLMSMYLVVTRCGQVWSLDARRLRKTGGGTADRVGPVLWAGLGTVLGVATLTGVVDSGGWLLILWGLWAVQGLWWAAGRWPGAGRGEPRALLDVLANLVHNAGLFVIMAEVCLIYATAGWYKIQGSRWQDGTAVHYPLHLDYFSPWPALADVLSANGVLLLIVTYGTVAAQVAFPFTLFNRRVKNVLLAVMVVEHAAIAVVLGLPFFSLAMISADVVFLPTSFLRRTGAWVEGLTDRVTGRGRRADASGGRRAERVPWPKVSVPQSSAEASPPPPASPSAASPSAASPPPASPSAAPPTSPATGSSAAPSASPSSPGAVGRDDPESSAHVR